MTFLVRTLAVLGLVVSLMSGCGFELRGETALPPGFERVFVNGSGAAATELRILLDGSGAELTTAAKESDAAVYLSGEKFSRRVLSVDPDTGKEREIELVYSISFHVNRGTGGTLLSRQTVRLRRDYVFDATAVIGKSYEATVLRREMRRDAAEQIMRRLGSSLKP